jgi:hypothetical protein
LEQPLLKTAPPLPVPGEESEELAIHQHTILEQGAAEAIHPVPPPAPVVRPPKRLDDDIVPTEPLFDDCWAPMIIELAFDDGWHSAQAHIGVVNMSWHNVVANRLQWSQLRAISTAIFKLLVLHWLQPLGYMLAFYLYQENLDTLQLILGLIVLGRECVYIILTLYSLYLTPTFLLMDTHATMVDKGTANLIDKGGFVYVVCFALAPEKFVMITILRDNQYNKKVWVSLMVLNILCDMAGIAALISAMITDTVFPALAVGYGATTVSGIVALLWLLSLFDIIDLRWCIQ